MNLNLLTDPAVFDNYETVTLTGAATTAASQGPATDADVQAIRRAVVTVEKSPSNGVYLGFETNWLVPFINTTLTPKPRDTVTDAGATVWTVLTIQLLSLQSRWKLGCVDLVLANQLFDQVNIEQAGVTYDAAGAPVRGWPSDAVPAGTVLYQALACRVQPQEQVIADRAAVRGGQTNYLIYLAQQVTLPNLREVRVVFGTQVFDVVSYQKPALITDLPALAVELRP